MFMKGIGKFEEFLDDKKDMPFDYYNYNPEVFKVNNKQMTAFKQKFLMF